MNAMVRHTRRRRRHFVRVVLRLFMLAFAVPTIALFATCLIGGIVLGNMLRIDGAWYSIVLWSVWGAVLGLLVLLLAMGGVAGGFFVAGWLLAEVVGIVSARDGAAIKRLMGLGRRKVSLKNR